MKGGGGGEVFRGFCCVPQGVEIGVAVKVVITFERCKGARDENRGMTSDLFMRCMSTVEA